jgi:hypothetical protein
MQAATSGYYVYLFRDEGSRRPLMATRPLSESEMPSRASVEWAASFPSEDAAWEAFERLME